MKLNSLATLLALLLLSVSCLGQLSNGGEAVDVIDGRTIVVQTASGRVRVELQFIDVPEAGQQLHETVKDHLHKLLIGRVVEFKPRVIFPDRVLGRVLLNNVDVSQQMLRDGAAWHVPIKMSGQDQGGFNAYASAEAAARMEKRGVWSIVGLKSPAEFRAENEAKLRQIDGSRPTRRAMVGVSEFQTDTRTRPSPTKGKGVAKTEKSGVRPVNEPIPTRAEDVNAEPPRPVLAAAGTRGTVPELGVLNITSNLERWVAALHVSREETGLKKQTDPSGAYTSISTPHAVLEFASEDGKQTVECRAVYAVASSLKGSGEPLFLLGFRATSKENDLLKGTESMTVVAERYVVPLTPVEGATEIRYYRISKGFLVRIANTRTVDLQLDGFKATLSEEAKEFFKQLLSATQ